MSTNLGVGRARIYNTDGSGRDTYISLNNGGFTALYSPVKSMQPGSFGPA